MSDKVKPWHQRRPRQENKKNKPLRIGRERIVPLEAGDYEDDRFPRDDFEDDIGEEVFPR